MASRLAEIYRNEKQAGGGLGSAIGKSLKEKIDPRKMFDQKGLLVSMFPSLKTYNATPKNNISQKISGDSDGGGVDNSILSSIAATSSLTAKNSMSLPMMARDMNLMKSNIFKLVKLQGGTANTNKTDVFWKNAKDRESIYENTIGKFVGAGKLGQGTSSKQKRDGQSSDKALFVTGGTGENETSLLGGALEALGKSATLARMATLASSVLSSPLFLASAGVLATVALAKKLRDDEINSNPEKYASVASERAKREGTSNKAAGASNTREAIAGTSTNDKGQRKIIVTRGTADEILQRLIEDKIFGQPETNIFCSSIVRNATIENVLETASDNVKATYLKMVADNTPKQTTPTATPTVLPDSPAGGGRGFVNPESVTPSPAPSASPSVAPSNAVMTASGPLMSGSGGYVTSGEPSTPSPTSSPSPVSTTGTGEGTMGAYKSRGVSPSAVSSATIGTVPGIPIDYASYAEEVGKKESGGKYDTVNSIGYVGKYQFGAMALEDMGLVKKGIGKKGQKALNDPENWTISGGKSAFLQNAQLQEDTMKRYTMQNFKSLNRLGIINKDTSPQQIAGYLAASHLLGPGGALALAQGKSGSDAYGTTSASYFKVGAATQSPGSMSATGTASASLTPASTPSSPSTGVKVASASTSVSDGKMAAMTTTGGNTVVNAPVTNTLASNSGGGNNVSPYNSDMMKYLLGAIT
jgi:hypothetical protein